MRKAIHMLEDEDGWKVEIIEVPFHWMKIIMADINADLAPVSSLSSQSDCHAVHILSSVAALSEWRRCDLQQSDPGSQEGVQAGGGAGGQRGAALRPALCASRGDEPVEPEHTGYQSESLTFFPTRLRLIGFFISCETVTYKRDDIFKLSDSKGDWHHYVDRPLSSSVTFSLQQSIVIPSRPFIEYVRLPFSHLDLLNLTFPSLGLQVLKRVGPETIVTHEVSAETAGNLIGQRDFVSVRHSCRQKSSVYLGGAAIQLESFPPQAGFVR